MKTLYIMDKKDLPEDTGEIIYEHVDVTRKELAYYNGKNIPVVIFANRCTAKIVTLMDTMDMMNIPYTLYSKGQVLNDSNAKLWASTDVREWFENKEISDLEYSTKSLIIKNRIPKAIWQHIDDYLDYEELFNYGITLSVQVLPVVKMNTYKPTDLQRSEWGIKDKAFAFCKEKAQCRYISETTLYDKLIAWLTLEYYKKEGIEPDPQKGVDSEGNTADIDSIPAWTL